MGEAEEPRLFRRPRATGGRSSSASGRRGSIRSRLSSPSARTSPRCGRRTRAWRRGSRPSRATGSPGGSSAGAVTARPASSTCATAAARSSSMPARTCSARSPIELLVDLDLGDIVGVEGTALATRRGGELSLAIDRWRLLAKSLRPPPDKFHGLEDVETRYRKRELDLIANEESRRLFGLRARTVSEVRRWLDERGFVEVETPVLQPLYGGALARPVHHPPQRPRPRPLPAHRHRALPQAARRRRHRPRLRAGQGLPQRGHLAQAQPRVHDARVVRGLRRLRGDRAPGRDDGRRGGRAASGHDHGPARRRRDRLRAALAADHPARGDPRAQRDRHRRAPHPRGAGGGDGDSRPSPRRAGASWSTACSPSSSSRS